MVNRPAWQLRFSAVVRERMVLWIALLLLLLTGFARAAEGGSRNLAVRPGGDEARRVALVIGNASYPNAPLKNPANDARAMARALRTLGFDVTLKENIALKEMSRAVTQFGEKLATGGSMGLFYFAGHGIQSKGKNYLVPIDAQITGESSVRSETLDVDVVLEQLATSPLNIVILDACRNNPFERRFRGNVGGLVQMDAPKGTLIAYATAPGKVALDGEGKNGLYTAALLKVISEPGLKVEDVFKRVRVNVATSTADQQVPWESSSLTGDFYFSRSARLAAGAAEPPAASAPPASAASASSGAAMELAFWESVERSNTVADYSTYLDEFPDGQFAALARNRMTKLASGAQLASLAPGPIPSRGAVVAPPTPPKVGDYWRYRGSNQNGPDAPDYRVTRVDENGIELRYVSNRNEQMTLVVNRDWNPIVQLGQQGAEDIKFVPFAPQFQFPLEPGKKWRASYKADCGMLCGFESEYESEVRGWSASRCRPAPSTCCVSKAAKPTVSASVSRASAR